MAKIALIKNDNNVFYLAHDSDYEEAKKIKAGEVYMFEFKKPRNYQFHKKFFALIKLVFDNQEHYRNMEHLRHDLTIRAGYYDIRYDMDGGEIQDPKSISFGSMDELEFNEFYNAVVDTIVKYFHFDKQDLIDNVAQYF